MKKVVGFGDFMLRLSPEGYLRFYQADRFGVNYTGAEANVCVSLAHMGLETEFVTKLPDNAIARAGLGELRKHGVNVGRVVFGGERMGVFYLEKGAAQRPSRIVYDRTHTAVADCAEADFDWQEVFRDADWFHLTGITPALSKTIAPVCAAACRSAHERGMTVSCDLNYRKNLWTTAEARTVMEGLLPYVDVLLANEEDAEKVLDIRADNSDITQGKLDDSGYVEVAQKIEQKYGIHTVAISMRRSISASDNDWGALLYAGGKPWFSRRYQIHLVDRVGGGDSFAAGLIYALKNRYEPQEAIEYAAAASCLKQTMELDFNLSTVEEVRALMGGDGSGRVQR